MINIPNDVGTSTRLIRRPSPKQANGGTHFRDSYQPRHLDPADQTSTFPAVRPSAPEPTVVLGEKHWVMEPPTWEERTRRINPWAHAKVVRAAQSEVPTSVLRRILNRLRGL